MNLPTIQPLPASYFRDRAEDCKDTHPAIAADYLILADEVEAEEKERAKK